MKRINHKKNLSFSIILLLILIIGIGYAYLTSNLSITGQTEVVANTWNIHFENLNVKDGSVTATTPATFSSNQTVITYTISLSRPKDFYEFTVDVKNDGTLPGKVSISELSGITTEAEPIVDYTITYTNGLPVNIGDILNAGTKRSIKVRIYYKDDITSEDFPSNDLNLNLIYTLQYIQSEEDAPDINTEIMRLKDSNTCIEKYEGDVTDQVGQTVTATKVYFDNCSDKRTIIFAGFCWQVIRTTETGGVKLLYYGKPSNNQCPSSRINQRSKAPYTGTFSSYTVDSNYLYGSSFIIQDDNTFVLKDTFTATWSDSTYEDLIGKYTCMSNGDTCSYMYTFSAYKSNTEAHGTNYHVYDENDANIAYGPFTSYNSTFATVGYMYNKIQNLKEINPGTNTYKFGNTFTYNTNTNTYTLSGTTQDISNWSSGYNQINNTHYTCWNNTGVCNTISYVYQTTTSSAHYLEMNNGKEINDVLADMLYNDGVNKYSSSVKGIIDNWYKYNLLDYSSKFEDAVYCNSRVISDYLMFNPNGGNVGFSIQQVPFKNYNWSTDLSCNYITNQFSVSNNKAKLTYPIALITSEEVMNINNNNLVQYGGHYWTITPKAVGVYSNSFGSINVTVTSAGGLHSSIVSNPMGIRPTIALSSNAIITAGTGSETDPWIVE